MNWSGIFKEFPINFKKNKINFIFFVNLVLFLFLVSILFLPKDNVLSGQGIVECKSDVCTWGDLAETFGNLIKTLVSVSFWLASLFSIIGAFLIMFQGANPTLYKRGVEIIKIAIFSYVLILLSGVIFDVILDFFTPKFQSYLETKFVFADDIDPRTYFGPLEKQVSSGLRCGQKAKNSIDKIIDCASEAMSALSNLTIILLGVAIFVSGGYLILTPFLGLSNIQKAWKILLWSTVGLLIVLLAPYIADQVKKLITSPYPKDFYHLLIKPVLAGDQIQFGFRTVTVKVCPPSILTSSQSSSGQCSYPSVEDIVKSISSFIIEKLAPPLLVLLIIIGGFFYLLSPFDIKNIQTGHNYIKWAIYGYFILLIITAVLSIISSFFGGPNVP
jgi:hypothetical protein